MLISFEVVITRRTSIFPRTPTVSTIVQITRLQLTLRYFTVFFFSNILEHLKPTNDLDKSPSTVIVIKLILKFLEIYLSIISL